MERSLFQFEASWMGEAVLAELEKEGIHGRLLFRPREYSSLITGGLQDGVELFVAEPDFPAAQKVLERFLSTSNNTERSFAVVGSSEAESKLVRNEGRRAVILSCIGFLLPVIFNILATTSFFRYLKQPGSVFQKSLVFGVLALGWLAALWTLKTLVASAS